MEATAIKSIKWVHCAFGMKAYLVFGSGGGGGRQCNIISLKMLIAFYHLRSGENRLITLDQKPPVNNALFENKRGSEIIHDHGHNFYYTTINVCTISSSIGIHRFKTFDSFGSVVTCMPLLSSRWRKFFNLTFFKAIAIVNQTESKYT